MLENLSIFNGLTDVAVVEEEEGLLGLPSQGFGLLDPYPEFAGAVEVVVPGAGAPPGFCVTAMKANVADGGCLYDDRRHHISDLRFIHANEADPVVLEQVSYVGMQPTPVPELREVGEVWHSIPTRLDIGPVGRRVPKAPGELSENPFELAGVDQWTDGLSKPIRHLAISALMSAPSMCLYGEAEALRRSVRHMLEDSGGKQLIKGGIDLDDVEVVGVEDQPVPSREVEGIEDASPAVEAVARGADPDDHILYTINNSTRLDCTAYSRRSF